MEVYGYLLKERRERIRRANPGRGTEKNPKMGTQKWLAKEAYVERKCVQRLEKVGTGPYGEASETTLKRVCKALGENDWKQYIVNYAQGYIFCKANKYIDFRPVTSPKTASDSFSSSVMMMTIDPLSICAEADHLESYTLENIKATLSGLEERITFSWYAEVNLTEEGCGWLGKVRVLDQLNLEANNEWRSIPIMFRQDGIRVSWESFVNMVESSSKSHLSIEVELVLSHCTKKHSVAVCVHCLQRLFKTGRKVHKSSFPHRVQVPIIDPAHEE